MTSLRDQSQSARPGRFGFGFWAVSYAFLVLMGFSTAPSPLYVLYGQRDDFSSLMVTLVYAVYAIGVLASLFFVSHRSDVHGRRVHLLAAIGLAVASGVLFIVWPSLPGLFVTRVISGVSVGLTVSTATAYLTELHRAQRPGTSTGRAALASTVANLGGLAVGALLAGLLAQYVAYPLVVPYAVLLGMLIIAALVVGIGPETRPRARPLPAYRPQRVSTPPEARGEFFAALLGVFFAYGPAALFIGTAGTFLATAVGNHSLAMAGAAIFIFFAAGSAFLVLTRTWSPRGLLAAGLVLDVVGLGLVVLAAWLPSPSLAVFLVGGGIAGPAAAALFKGTMGRVIAISPGETLGEALAGFFLAGYLGLSVPAIAIGVVLQYLSPRLTLLVFSAAIIAGVLAVSPVLLTRRQRSRTTETPARHEEPTSQLSQAARPTEVERHTISGRVHDTAHRAVAAVLTLLDSHSRQVDSTDTDEQGEYRLSAPSAGQYLLVCTPPTSGRGHIAEGPCHADWIRLDGTPLNHDIVADGAPPTRPARD
jgi:MFS family permease